MGIHDRDYMQASARPFAAYRPGRLTWILIGVNVLLWFIYSRAFNSAAWEVIAIGGELIRVPAADSTYAFLSRAFMLWPDDVFASGKVWQLFTSMWMHSPDSAQHVIFNMLALFFFGRVTETWLGPKRFLVMYIGAGLFASLVYVLYAFAIGSDTPALGASGAVFAVLVWLALQQPKSTVYMMMVIPMPMWLAVGVFILGLEFYQLAGSVASLESAGSQVAHLAGAAFGAGFWYLARRFSLPAQAQRRVSPRPSGAPSSLEESHRLTAMRLAVDALLVKVHEHGIASLTPDEKAFLEQASRELSGR